VRRSDGNLKHDVVLLGRLDNGLGYYRVIAQEVKTVRPDAVTHGSDGYLRVHYERLGLKFPFAMTIGPFLPVKSSLPRGARLPSQPRTSKGDRSCRRSD
jgi:hypothetical protein